MFIEIVMSKKTRYFPYTFYLGVLLSFGLSADPISNDVTKNVESVLKSELRTKESIIVRPLSAVQLAEKDFNKGVEFTKRGESIKALEQFTSSLSHDNTNPDTVVAMSKLYFKDGMHAKAITGLSEALKSHSDHDGIVTQLAFHLTALHQYEKVVDFLSNRDNGSGNIITNGLLAYAYIQTNRFNQATAIYRRLLLLNPKVISWQLGKAIGLEGSGNFEQALLSYSDLKSSFSLTTKLNRFVNLKIVNLHEQQELN